MKLDDFVSETLKQIIKGVVAAQEYGNTQNAKVNPITARFHSNTEGHAYCQETGVPLQKVGLNKTVTFMCIKRLKKTNIFVSIINHT